MTDTFTITVKRFDPADPRLGRHVVHDSRSLAYQVEAEPLSDLQSVEHERFIPILRQNIGSCTGNAATGKLGCGIFWPTISDSGALSTVDADSDETFAVGVYSDATKIDPWSGEYPPTDTGSDGLSVAKVLTARGLISGYEHATSLEATLTALSKQPVIVGTRWHGDMFKPATDGRLSITGDIAGGHEYLLRKLDVENRRVWLDNSWGPDWGLEGRAYLTWDDLGELLADDGDCTVFTPNNVPAPTPKPIVQSSNRAFRRAARRFDRALHTFLQTSRVEA